MDANEISYVDFGRAVKSSSEDVTGKLKEVYKSAYEVMAAVETVNGRVTIPLRKLEWDMTEVLHTTADAKVRSHVREMMAVLDPTGQRRSTDDTPKRVSRMYLTELCSGYYVNVENLFKAVFPNEGADGMVIVKDITLYSMCEHHWLMITGKAHVAYMPNDKVLGLSKVARVVDAYARRFQLQERITKQVHDAIDLYLQPKGTMVVIEAEHHCLTIRGAQKPGTITVTSALSGQFKTDASLKEEFLRAIAR